MNLAIASDLPPEQADAADLYEIVDGKKVWPAVGVPDDDKLYETVNGERKEIPRMGVLAATVASFLAGFINAFSLPRRLGVAVVEAEFAIRAGGKSRRPDVAYVSYDRWPYTGIPLNDPPAFEIVPNLAVEMNSPTNTADEIEERIADYFGAGVQLVWVVHPIRRRIYVYESLKNVRILDEGDELDGGPAIPGFRLPVADLFGAMVVPPPQP